MRSLPPGRGKRPIGPGVPAGRPSSHPAGDFEQLRASALYCPKCRQATPVRESLLLILPDGNIYDYRCAYCGTSTGSKTEKQSGGAQIVSP